MLGRGDRQAALGPDPRFLALFFKQESAPIHAFTLLNISEITP